MSLVFNKIIVFLIFILSFPAIVFAQYPSVVFEAPTMPPLPPCSTGCDDVCTPALCYDDPNDGILATCTSFCNYNTGYCAYTCSTYQETCTTGWGEWGVCDNCWQFRVCNDTPSTCFII